MQTNILLYLEVVWNYEDKQSVEAKNDILKFGILPILTFSLKQKFWKLEDGWNSSSKLARFLSYGFPSIFIYYRQSSHLNFPTTESYVSVPIRVICPTL